MDRKSLMIFLVFELTVNCYWLIQGWAAILINAYMVLVKVKEILSKEIVFAVVQNCEIFCLIKNHVYYFETRFGKVESLVICSLK